MALARHAEAARLVDAGGRQLDDAVAGVRDVGALADDVLDDAHQLVVLEVVIAHDQLRRLVVAHHLEHVAEQRVVGDRPTRRIVGVAAELERHLTGEATARCVLTQVLDEFGGKRAR